MLIEFTRSCPVPVFATVTVFCTEAPILIEPKFKERGFTDIFGVPVCVRENVAVTVFAVSIVTMHWPVPEHPPPLHPANEEPATGIAVNVITAA